MKSKGIVAIDGVIHGRVSRIVVVGPGLIVEKSWPEPVSEGGGKKKSFGANSVFRTFEKIKMGKDATPYAPRFGVGIALVGKEGESTVSSNTSPGVRGNRETISSTGITKSGNVKEDTASIKSDELHLFKPEEMVIVHDVGVIFTSSLDWGG